MSWKKTSEMMIGAAKEVQGIRNGKVTILGRHEEVLE